MPRCYAHTYMRCCATCYLEYVAWEVCTYVFIYVCIAAQYQDYFAMRNEKICSYMYICVRMYRFITNRRNTSYYSSRSTIQSFTHMGLATHTYQNINSASKVRRGRYSAKLYMHTELPTHMTIRIQLDRDGSVCLWL